MQKGGLLLLIVVALAVTSAPSQGASLNGAHATLRFSGTMTTEWSLPGKSTEDSCFIDTRHGDGKQLVRFSMPGRAGVTIVQAGGSIAFQLAPRAQAAPGHPAAGFPAAQIVRSGLVEDQFAAAPSGNAEYCGPPPAPTLADHAGCGTHYLPWDARPIVAAGRLMPGIATFPPSEIVARCPFYGVVGKMDANPTEMPTLTSRPIAVATVARDLSHRGGKVALEGRQSWTSENEGGLEVHSTNTVAWKLVIARR